MSRLNILKEQNPLLNISFIDFFAKIDKSKNKKYVPLMIKFLGKKVLGEHYKDVNIDELNKLFEDKIKLNPEEFSIEEKFIIFSIYNIFAEHDLKVIQKFIDLNEKKLIKNKDITSYNTLEDIQSAISLAELKIEQKQYEKQIIKVYEDDNWIAIKPLTFASSLKYGANTKWCTTFIDNKYYFYKYWSKGILIYFINKISGIKYAYFKSLSKEPDDYEVSLWNAIDKRSDFIDSQFEDYMLKVIHNLLNTDKTNQALCDEEIQKQVILECKYNNKEIMDEPVIREMGNGPLSEPDPAIPYNYNPSNTTLSTEPTYNPCSEIRL